MGSNPTSTARLSIRKVRMRETACHGEGCDLLEPQGTLFFLLLMAAFGALVVWLVLAKKVVFPVPGGPRTLCQPWVRSSIPPSSRSPRRSR